MGRNRSSTSATMCCSCPSMQTRRANTPTSPAMLTSAARAAGWLVALCPALCLAGVAVQVLQRINQAFARIEPLEITVLGQQVARLDFLEILRLSAAAQIVARLVGSLPLTFVLLAALLTL